MNYGKKSLKKNKSKLSNKKATAKKKFVLTFFKSIVALILVAIAAVALAFLWYAKNLISELPDVSTIDISPSGFSTTIYDKDGNEIESLASSGANRQYVTIQEIPEDLQHAFVAIEDARFYEHNGIDVRGILRAGVTAIITGDLSQGASTITQQLLKNNFFTNWTNEETKLDSINRKIQEQYLAIQLEKITTKDTILENYLNTINLGQNTLGVEAASERYFNKSVTELNLSESAVIAAITQNPSRYNPISNPEDNTKRRKKVLNKMLEQGYITQAQYDHAMDDDVYSRIQVVNSQVTSTSTSYFVDALTDQVIDDLMEQKGYTETQAYQKLYSGGLEIYSTQDPAIQNILDEEISNEDNYSLTKHSFSYRLTVTKADGSTKNYSDQTMLSYYQAENRNFSINYDSEEEAAAAIEAYKAEIMEPGDTIPEGGETITYTLQPQAAMTIMDQSTGHVVALTGGRGDKTASKTLNRATGITRQAGSTFKIISAYAPALDAGGLTLASVQDDAPMTYANGTPLKNYDNHYRGWTNFRTGIQWSINVVAVKTLTEIGTGLGYQYVQDFGISTLVSGDNVQALALGGITYGVKNVDLCGAYATIANEGYYNRPVFYTQVLDNRGNVVLDTTDSQPKQVIKETTAWLLINAMHDVVTAGTGTATNLSGQYVAGKTGTTTANRDAVFAGFTPYYTGVIWGGYDDNAVQGKTGYANKIWHQVMERVHEGLEYKDFPKPDGIVQVAVCSKSGKLPLEGICDQDPRGNMIYTEYFAEGTQPTETCDHHTRINICTETGMPASPGCPQESQVRILGGSPGSDDEPFLVTTESLSTTCPNHGGGGAYVFTEPVPQPTVETDPAAAEQPTE
ncbi:MAG: PBP1A family penicillin-binding protein [Lachnospiraceae bacterium]|nr:PBP1A family penicillin-binding protein [Lachnospiraceae bacterium]